MTEAKYGLHNFKRRSIVMDVMRLLDDDDLSAASAITATNKSTGVFWLSAIKHCIYTLERDFHGRAKEEERLEHFRTIFSFELTRWVIVYADEYINADVERFMELAYPRLGLLRAVSLVSWQAYMRHMPAAMQLRLFDRLNSPPPPFQDERFSVLPVHTNCYKKGAAHSPWLKDVEGHYQHVWDKENACRKLEKMDDAASGFYLDAKIGLLFLFEGRPSIAVSFNVDNLGNIFIHQVQAKVKDRGHYKLGANWRTRVTDYIKFMFTGSRVYLINGDQAAEDTYRSYGEQAPEGIKPNPTELSRIAQTYNEWEGLSLRRYKKSGRTFRKVT